MTTQTPSARGYPQSPFPRRSSGCTTQYRMCLGEQAVPGLSTNFASEPLGLLGCRRLQFRVHGQQPRFLGLGMRSLVHIAGTFHMFKSTRPNTCLDALAWILLS